MSLDVDLMVMQPSSVFSWNVTHNLGEMARQVDVGDDLNLYQVLWRPDEHELTLAHEIADYLHVGWMTLTAEPEKYKAFNPPNGWGSYEGLVEFVANYRDACYENPFAELAVSR